MARWPDLSDFHGLFEFEAEGRFGRQHDVLVAGESCAGATCARARNGANGGPLATARQTTDERADAGATAGHDGRTLAFTFFAARDRGGLNRVLLTVDGDGIERQPQTRTAFETPQGS